MTLKKSKSANVVTRQPRNRDQSMGIWINEPMFHNPSLMDKSIKTLADSGFGIIRLFLRNSNFTHRSPEFVSLVARAVELAHGGGMRAVLDCEPHLIVGQDMGREYPEAMGCKLLRVASVISDGHWLLRADTPPGEGARPVFDGIEAAFVRKGTTVTKIMPEYNARRETHCYRNGHIHREAYYREGTNIASRKAVELRGVLPDVSAGELVAYLRFTSHTLADFWSDGFKLYFDSLLECFRDIPLDGVGWDEPAIDGDWNSYRYGRAFSDAFEKLNGYRLKDKLYLLDEPGMPGEAVKVRLDYYRTLNEGLAKAQAALNYKARELWGDNLIFGTHHTWQGEGGINDYRAGAVDYFRLNDNMDAGYTDCSWWDPASVAYAYTLASSLGRLTTSGEADVNTWHFKPTVANIRRNVNLMTLMDIDWFNIWFGSDNDCIMQEGHYTWPETVRKMNMHRKLQLALGRKKPVADVAIWHGWEGVCAWNRAGLANAQKSFCLNTSELFIKRGICADFIDSRLIMESRIESGRLVNRLGKYKVLIMPYALAMPRNAFKICAEFAKAGGRLVFVGTPVASDENGKPLSAEFAKLFGTQDMTAEHYMRGLDVECTLPDFRPQQLEVCRQLSSSLPNRLISCEGEIHGVKASSANAVFLTDLDPQQRLVEQIEDSLSKTVRVHGGNILWRLYRDKSELSLMLVSADERPCKGVVIWGDSIIEIDGGFAGLLTLGKSGKPNMVGDLSWRKLNGESRHA